MHSTLTQILKPVPVQRFFEHHWEQQPLHLSRTATDHFSNSVSVEDIETLLSTRDLYFPAVQLSRQNDPVPANDYSDDTGRILPLRLAALHREGATIIISQAHRHFPALAEWTRNLQAELGWRCQMNLYLTPAGSQGFASHYDTHDVFVLQISGRKSFRFFDGGVELPFCDESYDPQATGERILNSTSDLEAGDTLYIPRGVLHDAVAADEQPSLHITVGIFPIAHYAVLQEALHILAERDVALRHSQPMPGQGIANEPNHCWRLAQTLSDRLDADLLSAARSRLLDDVTTNNQPLCQGLLHATWPTLQANNPPVLIVNDNLPLHTERTGNFVALRLPGQVLELEDPLGAALEQVLAAGKLKPDQWEGLNADQQHALSHRLLMLNVVRLETEQNPIPTGYPG